MSCFILHDVVLCSLLVLAHVGGLGRNCQHGIWVVVVIATLVIMFVVCGLQVPPLLGNACFVSGIGPMMWSMAADVLTWGSGGQASLLPIVHVAVIVAMWSRLLGIRCCIVVFANHS